MASGNLYRHITFSRTALFYWMMIHQTLQRKYRWCYTFSCVRKCNIEYSNAFLKPKSHMLSPCQLSLEVRHAFNILLILHQNQNLRRDWRKCKSHIIPTDGSSSCATWLAISSAMWCILSEFLVCTIIIFELVDTNSKWHQLDLCYQPNHFQFP